MKNKFYNQKKAEEELRAKELEKKNREDRELYFQSLKKNRKFQKYVVEEILKSHIKSLTDTRNIQEIGKKSKDDLADLILANLKASKTLESILNKLL